jgi:AcrR family transcriptional regulator
MINQLLFKYGHEGEEFVIETPSGSPLGGVDPIRPVPQSPVLEQPRPKQERSRVNRESLLDALESLLLERPYSEIGISEIARRAGLTTGALYARFGDKRGLALALYERFAQDSIGAFNAWASRPDWASATPRTIIAEWTRGAVSFCRMHRPLLSLMMNDTAVRQRYNDLIAVPASYLAHLVSAAVGRDDQCDSQSDDRFRAEVEWAACAAVAVLERFELDGEIESRVDNMLCRLIGVKDQ